MSDMYEQYLWEIDEKLDEIGDIYEEYADGHITEKELKKQLRKRISALILKLEAFREDLEADAE